MSIRYIGYVVHVCHIIIALPFNVQIMYYCNKPKHIHQCIEAQRYDQ